MQNGVDGEVVEFGRIRGGWRRSDVRRHAAMLLGSAGRVSTKFVGRKASCTDFGDNG